VRALVVTNMYPSPARPAYGSFVRDQVEALRRRDDVEVALHVLQHGPRGYATGALELRRAFRGERFDVVHAHFGLTAWPAVLSRLGPVVVTLHGNDLFDPRSRAVTLGVLPLVALPAAVSRAFSQNLPGAGSSRRVAVLPVGADLERFRPIPRAEARRHLGLPEDEPCLLFPHDPGRPLKRFDRAQQVAGATRLLTMGQVPPEEVPFWINAANAVLVPSQDEGFGLAAVEALACGVPVLATPVGIHATVLDGVPGAFCAPFDAARWRAELEPLLADPDPRSDGRERAALFSADRMADRVVAAWRAVVAEQESPQHRPILGRSRR
jgi:teichuronic acid biosynthesis glycosyltransferase TuaC